MKEQGKVFNEVADSYNELLEENLGALSGDLKYYAEYKIHFIKKHLQIKPIKILEFGCGAGRGLPFLREAYPEAEIWGCDISEKSLELAKKSNPNVTFFNSATCDIEDLFFDFIYIANVFHHIPPNERFNVMHTIDQLLSQNGTLIMFEHNPYNPVTRHMVNTCPFDEDAVLLTLSESKKLFKQIPFKLTESKYTLFIPSPLKKFAFIEPYLSFLPLGGQYAIWGQKKA